MARTEQEPTLPEVIVTRPVDETSHAPPLATNDATVPPGVPVTCSEAVLPYANVVGGGGLNDNVGDSRIGEIEHCVDAAS